MRILVTCIALGALLSACGREEDDLSRTEAERAAQLGQSEREAAEDRQAPPAWVARAQARVSELRDRIRQLEARAPDVPAEFRERFDSTVKELRNEADELEQDLRKAAGEAGADWEALRQDVNEEFREMGREIDETSAAVGSARELFTDTRQTIGAWLEEAGEAVQPAPAQGTRPAEGAAPAPADRPEADRPTEVAPPR